jgi:hypothetical protein
MGRPDPSTAAAPARRRQETAALHTLLLAPPAEWLALAPALVSRLGVEQLTSVVEATRERLGGFSDVMDSPDGLLIAGPRGAVSAWARTDDGGRLIGLLVSPELRRGRWDVRLRPAVRRAGSRLVWCALVAFWVESCWTATTRADQAAALVALATVTVLLEGFAPVAMQPWWFRRPLEAALAGGVASAIRAPDLPSGTVGAQLLVGALALVCAGGLLRRARHHRWGAAVRIGFPLQGSWYVAQGGGYGLNHHVGFPEQRGAVDLVRVGPNGTLRRRTPSGRPKGPERYLAFGAPVHSPCDGIVVSVADGMEDQTPGRIRYGPPYGNHVFIDTGSELVKLAHLRAGTVRVALGDRVVTGQLLGEVGNSGNSSEPHLHLHVERAGVGLDLRIAGDDRPLHRGRTVPARRSTPQRKQRSL